MKLFIAIGGVKTTASKLGFKARSEPARFSRRVAPQRWGRARCAREITLLLPALNFPRSGPSVFFLFFRGWCGVGVQFDAGALGALAMKTLIVPTCSNKSVLGGRRAGSACGTLTK